MNFKDILLEQTLTTDEALQLLGLDKNQEINSDVVKAAYRKAAFANHPDRGGSQEKMKMINIAYEKLKSYSKQSSTNFKDQMEAGIKRYQEVGVAIKTELLSKIKPEAFIKYFKDISGLDFFFTIKKSYPKGDERYGLYSAGFQSEFHTKDRNTIFTYDISVDLTDAIHNKGKLGSSEITYKMYTSAYCFHNNKKQKLTQRDWGFSDKTKILTDPEALYPKAKLNKIFGGSSRKDSKFAKRDAITFIEKKLKGKIIYSGNQVWGYIPIDKVGELQIYRTTFGKGFAGWSIFGLGKEKLPFKSFPESEATFLFFEKLQKEAKSTTQLAHMIITEYERIHK